MSRVEKLGDRDTRSLLVTVVALVLALFVVLAVVVLALPSLTRSGKVQSQLGSATFNAGSASKRAKTIAHDGPLLFSDVASGNRDIWLQHTGTTDNDGWLAFDARRKGVGRECTLRWNPDRGSFTDPCDNTEIPADGTGLTHYVVTVDDDDHVVIDLRAASTDQLESTPNN